MSLLLLKSFTSEVVSSVIVEERLLDVGESETSSPIDLAIFPTTKSFFRGDDGSE